MEVFNSIKDAIEYGSKRIEHLRKIMPLSLIYFRINNYHGYQVYIEVSKQISKNKIEILKYICSSISNKDYVEICKYAIINRPFYQDYII